MRWRQCRDWACSTAIGCRHRAVSRPAPDRRDDVSEPASVRRADNCQEWPRHRRRAEPGPRPVDSAATRRSAPASRAGSGVEGLPASTPAHLGHPAIRRQPPGDARSRSFRLPWASTTTAGSLASSRSSCPSTIRGKYSISLRYENDRCYDTNLTLSAIRPCTREGSSTAGRPPWGPPRLRTSECLGVHHELGERRPRQHCDRRLTVDDHGLPGEVLHSAELSPA